MGEQTVKQSPTPPQLPENITAEAIRAQMAKILSSASFVSAERMSRFLAFALEETLAGRGAGLKEYSIGVSVFDRPAAAFDPRTEPIVRVEARRLRTKLDTYYESEGKADRLLIELPKGGYTLRFALRGQQQHSAPPAQPDERAPRLAVLPFTTLGGPDAAEDYFVEGLTEELIHLLLQMPGLDVIAWNSSARLRDPADMARATRELDLSHFLRGAVRRSGAQIKISVQLVEASSGRFLWSEMFERDVSSLRMVEEEISRAIAGRLRISFHKPAVAATDHVEPGSAEHHHYLMGRFHANKRTLEGLNMSVASFEKAIKLHPDYGLAHTALADSLTLLTGYGDIHPREAFPRARAAAQVAASHSERAASAAGYSSLGIIAAKFDWNWAEAERLFRRSISIDPNYATAHHWLGADLLAVLGRFDEALEEMAIAKRLDPLSPVIAADDSVLLMLVGRFEEAISTTRALMEFDPHFYLGHATLGRILTLMGRYQEALSCYEQARMLVDRFTPKVEGAYAQTLALAGHRAEAEAIRSRLYEVSIDRYVPAVTLGIVEMGLGNIDAAVSQLEQAATNCESSTGLFGVHPLYDPLRKHPRFQALLARMDLLTVSNLR